ncbi:uncharacterized protein LOC129593073 [Paramacrobiotus metropolitanus]|uniref:uncharacterized protein LOC129593073 n=1 Tax=Paramacrobiotus metropolitanus TaxID=2943436 RepID=UPI002445E454|nr:uncharacterized protein LOC129593073 [Paramacrobiotus metropolitanus]
MFSFAAVFGAYLEMYTPSVEMASEYNARSMAYMRGMDYFTYFFGNIGFVNTIIRIGGFCKLHNAAQSFRKQLRMVHLTDADDAVLSESNLLKRDTSKRDGAVTVYGLMALSTDYVIAFFGLAITYIIFVYQAKDSRKTVEDLKALQMAHHALTLRMLNQTV